MTTREQQGGKPRRTISGTAQLGPAAPAAPRAPAAPQAPKAPPPVPAAPAAAGLEERAIAAPKAVDTAAGVLLKLESELRQSKSRAELAYFMANEPRVLTRAQQVAVFARDARGKLKVTAVSSLTVVDRSSPVVMWFEDLIAKRDEGAGLDAPLEFDAAALASGDDSVARAYPLKFLLWIPLLDIDGHAIGGFLQARSVPWSEQEIAIGRHLASACAHTWLALGGSPIATWLQLGLTRKTMALAAALVAALCFMPISISALAPVEVAPRDAFVVTSGVDGVVDMVEVSPNAPIAKGQLLLRLTDTDLRNRYDIAEREVAVAQSRYKKAAQLAFADMRGRHELGLALAELDLKMAERDYARDLLGRTEIRAERDGVAVFADKKDLIGRPVAVGEKLMEIADPRSMEFRIDLAVSDSIVLHDGARVKVFLDSDPLHPIEANLVRTSYRARVRENQQLAYRLVAELPQGQTRDLRLGVRGTAQVYGDKAPLAFYLFRRPLTALRQLIGI